MSSFLAVALFAVFSLCQAAPQFWLPEQTTAHPAAPITIDGNYDYSYQTAGMVPDDFRYPNAFTDISQPKIPEGIQKYLDSYASQPPAYDDQGRFLLGPRIARALLPVSADPSPSFRHTRLR